MEFDYKQFGSDFGQGFFSSGIQAGFDFLKSFESTSEKIDETVSRFFKAMGKGFSEAFDATNASFNWSILTRTVPTVGIFLAVSAGVPLALRYLFELLIGNIGKPKMGSPKQVVL